jgi:hypothetical protein
VLIELSNGKEMKMKTADEEKTRGISVRSFFCAIPANTANLIVQSILNCLKACLRHSMSNMQFVLSRSYSQKRVINQISHSRKFAVFTGSARQGHISLMATKRKVWLSAIASTILVLVVIFTVVKASPERGGAIKKEAVKKRFSVQQWYGITPTSNSNTSAQNVTGQISAPPLTNATDCAQTDNFGDYCGVLVEFSSSAPSVSNISVASLLSTYSGTIVTSAGTDGYSNKP